MGELEIHHLAPGEVDRAYVLARLGYPNLSVESWRKVAKAARAPSDRAGGILFAQDSADRALGLLMYAIAPTMAGRPCLTLERLIAFDLIDPRPVADALVGEVLRLAQARDCESLSLVGALGAPRSDSALVLASPVSVLHRIF